MRVSAACDQESATDRRYTRPRPNPPSHGPFWRASRSQGHRCPSEVPGHTSTRYPVPATSNPPAERDGRNRCTLHESRKSASGVCAPKLCFSSRRHFFSSSSPSAPASQTSIPRSAPPSLLLLVAHDDDWPERVFRCWPRLAAVHEERGLSLFLSSPPPTHPHRPTCDLWVSVVVSRKRERGLTTRHPAYPVDPKSDPSGHRASQPARALPPFSARLLSNRPGPRSWSWFSIAASTTSATSSTCLTPAAQSRLLVAAAAAAALHSLDSSRRVSDSFEPTSSLHLVAFPASSKRSHLGPIPHLPPSHKPPSLQHRLVSLQQQPSTILVSGLSSPTPRRRRCFLPRPVPRLTRVACFCRITRPPTLSDISYPPNRGQRDLQSVRCRPPPAVELRCPSGFDVTTRFFSLSLSPHPPS